MSPTFEDRLGSDGIYARTANIMANSKEALANIDTAKDIHSSLSYPWGKTSNNKTTHFKRRNTNNDLIVNIFGEVLGRSGGTALGVLGGSNLKSGQVSDSILAYSYFALSSRYTGFRRRVRKYHSRRSRS